MSWLSSALGGIGHAVEGIGHTAGQILSNPIVDAGLTFIPGIGPVAAGLAGAAGGLLKPGGNLGSAISGGLSGGLAGMGAQSVAGLLGGGAAGAGAGAAGGAASAIPDSAIPAAGHGGVLGSLEGLAGKAGDFLTGNGGKNALGIAQGINAALQQKQANDYAKQALGSVEGSYAERAPLRAQGIKGLLQSNTGNPYASGSPTAPMPVRGY